MQITETLIDRSHEKQARMQRLCRRSTLTRAGGWRLLGGILHRRTRPVRCDRDLVLPARRVFNAGVCYRGCDSGWRQKIDVGFERRPGRCECLKERVGASNRPWHPTIGRRGASVSSTDALAALSDFQHCWPDRYGNIRSVTSKGLAMRGFRAQLS